MEISISTGVDWPAWVQAVGSILVILVSAGFAIWVPLHLRRLEARDTASRALTNCIAAGRQIDGAWASLHQILAEGQFHGGTRLILGVNIEGVRALLAQAPRSFLGDEALLAVNVFQMQCSGLESAVSALERDATPERIAQIPFDGVSAQISEKIEELLSMGAIQTRGYWHVGKIDKANKR